MSQFAAPDSLHIYPILIDKPNAKNQSVFSVHWWTENSKKFSFWAGGLSNLSPVFSFFIQDRQLRRLVCGVNGHQEIKVPLNKLYCFPSLDFFF